MYHPPITELIQYSPHVLGLLHFRPQAGPFKPHFPQKKAGRDPDCFVVGVNGFEPLTLCL